MKSIKKILLYGFLIWLIPFLVSILIFPLKTSTPALFESITPVVITIWVVLFSLLYCPLGGRWEKPSPLVWSSSRLDFHFCKMGCILSSPLVKGDFRGILISPILSFRFATLTTREKRGTKSEVWKTGCAQVIWLQWDPGDGLTSAPPLAGILCPRLIVGG